MFKKDHTIMREFPGARQRRPRWNVISIKIVLRQRALSIYVP